MTDKNGVCLYCGGKSDNCTRMFCLLAWDIASRMNGTGGIPIPNDRVDHIKKNITLTEEPTDPQYWKQRETEHLKTPLEDFEDQEADVQLEEKYL